MALSKCPTRRGICCVWHSPHNRYRTVQGTVQTLIVRLWPRIRHSQPIPSIRIHRNTLRQIGNPEYIQLLVNPDQKMIGIKASCAEDKLAHKVKDYFVINGNSYELYSRELLYSLSQLNLSWEKFNIFRLEGNIYPDKKIALFSMDNIITKLPQTEFKSEIMGDEYAQL